MGEELATLLNVSHLALLQAAAWLAGEVVGRGVEIRVSESS